MGFVAEQICNQRPSRRRIIICETDAHLGYGQENGEMDILSECPRLLICMYFEL